jgi:hypothetical protein
MAGDELFAPLLCFRLLWHFFVSLSEDRELLVSLWFVASKVFLAALSEDRGSLVSRCGLVRLPSLSVWLCALGLCLPGLGLASWPAWGFMPGGLGLGALGALGLGLPWPWPLPLALGLGLGLKPWAWPWACWAWGFALGHPRAQAKPSPWAALGLVWAQGPRPKAQGPRPKLCLGALPLGPLGKAWAQCWALQGLAQQEAQG